MADKKAKANKVAELTADLQRIQADFANYKRRSGESHKELLDLAKQDVILQLLPLLDNLARAQAHVPPDLTENDWVKGMLQITAQAEQVLASMGVTKINSLGQAFDPHLHEAIGYEEGDPSTGSGQVAEVVSAELQPGYQIADKIIRHAIVKVKRITNKEKN